MLIIGSHKSIASFMTVPENATLHEPPHLTMNHWATDAGATAELSQ